MDHIVQSYENYREEDRLTTNNSRKLEFLTTIRVFSDLFPKQGKILDCAAGTGIYAFYLADRGYDVTATDLTPRHIRYINDMKEKKPYKMDTAVLDATDLDLFPDKSFDIVLNMGPFYHLTDESMRARCLAECLRVLKKGGLLVTAYISRFNVFPYVALADERYMKSDLADRLLQTGVLRHDDPNCFWTDTYYSSPDEMELCYKNSGVEIIDHFAQDGISPMLKHKIDGLSEEQFEIWSNWHYAVCREKSMLGASNHGAIIGRKLT